MKRDKTVTVRVVLSLAMVALACALSYVFTSCTQEPPLPYDGGQREHVDFSLKLTLPGAFTPAATRGGMDEANQNAVNSAVVLVFKDNVLLFQQKGTVSEIDGAGGVTKRVEVTLNISPSEGDLYDIMVIGNPPADFNFASYLSETKDKLKSEFNVPVVGRWAGSEFIMYGEKLQTPLNPTANNFEIEMLRSLAQVDIGVGVYDAVKGTWEGPVGVFRLREVLVVNRRDKYAVIPAAAALNESGKVIAPTIPADAKVQGSTVDTAIKYSGSPDITDSYTKSAIFLAEAPNGTDRVTLLVGGSYMGNGISYYRIDMCVPKADAPGEYDYLNILRNHLYRISITRVESNGFDTPEEALLADPINIATELTVTAEGGLGDIVFDDNSYIQTDASSVLIYGAPDGTKTYPIATVKANFVEGVTATVTGPGIPSAIDLVSDEATPITAILDRTTTGSYTIRVGRLTKEIPLNIQPPVDAHFDFLPFKNVSSISIEKPQPWLTLSQKPTYLKSEQRSSYVAGDVNGKACFHFEENIATTGNPRTAEALVQRNDNSGTTRVVFEQHNLTGMVLGYFGGVKDPSGYTKLLAVEAVEEHDQRVYDDYLNIKGNLGWGFRNRFIGFINIELGQEATISLGRDMDNGVSLPYTINHTYAARYCYDKNRDVNGDRVINDAEVVWYLPAQNQLMAAWIALSGVPTTAPFDGSQYWVTKEHTTTDSWYVNFGHGITATHAKNSHFRVRCVRELIP